MNKNKRTQYVHKSRIFFITNLKIVSFFCYRSPKEERQKLLTILQRKSFICPHIRKEKFGHRCHVRNRCNGICLVFGQVNAVAYSSVCLYQLQREKAYPGWCKGQAEGRECQRPQRPGGGRSGPAASGAASQNTWRRDSTAAGHPCQVNEYCTHQKDIIEFL